MDDPHRGTDAFLARAPLFAGLDPDTVGAIAALVHSRRYAAGHAICREGDPSGSVPALRCGFARRS